MKDPKVVFMKYHTPDPIWSFFVGIENYESYISKTVVPGCFHQKVPKEIVESYTIVEFILAYAWYHYPLLDEALVKLLRILEMGIKMRCTQLGIALKNTNKQGKEVDINLNHLIDALTKAEPEKQIKTILDWMRNTRNHLMHPKEKTLFGAAGLTHIKECIIMLNALFLPQQYFLDSRAELERLHGLSSKFNNGQFILNYQGLQYLSYKLQVVETFLVDGSWLVLCSFQIVEYKLADDGKIKPTPEQFIYLVSDLKFGEGTFSGINYETHEPFIFTIDLEPSNTQILTQFKSDLIALGEDLYTDKSMARINIKMKISEMRYRWWGA